MSEFPKHVVFSVLSKIIFDYFILRSNELILKTVLAIIKAIYFWSTLEAFV